MKGKPRVHYFYCCTHSKLKEDKKTAYTAQRTSKKCDRPNGSQNIQKVSHEHFRLDLF